jgi:hypothetical protein
MNGETPPPPLEWHPLDALRTVTLTKRKAWGAAPWTDHPYAYVWYVATDQLGRSIAGESWIVETPIMPWELQC